MNYLEKIKELKVRKLDTSYSECKYLASYNEHHYEINNVLYDLICVLQSTKSLDEAVEKFSLMKGKVYSISDITNVIDNKISVFFVENKQNEKKPFIYNIDILSSSSVNKVASILQYFFSFRIHFIVLVINIILAIYFFYNYFEMISFSLERLDLYTFLLVFIILFISTFFHELGHASACKHCGELPGAIGFGIYINIPVFYADVTNIWALDRRKRMLVNLGGVYFQGLLLIPCYLAFFHSHNSLLGYLILCTVFNFLFVLNPFLKFDGYWILSDFLGIPNLRQRANELITYFLNKIRKKGDVTKPKLLCLKPVQKYIALAYTLLTGAFMIFFFLYFIPRFIYGYIHEVPETYRILESNISKGNIPYDLIFYLLPKTFLFLLIAYYIIKLLYKFSDKLIFNLRYFFKNKTAKV